MKPDKKRRNAVARILEAENKSEQTAAEAKRLGVSTRTMERYVEAAKAATPSVGQSDVSESTAPPEKGPENTVLESLLKDEAAAVGTPGGPPTVVEKHQAAVDAENFCVEAYSGLRATVGSLMVSVRYSPPLDATSPEVAKLLKMGVAAELALRANAPRLYPILVKYSSGWAPLVLAVGADAFGMIVGLETLAKSKGWTSTTKKEAAAIAPPPSKKSYAEQLAAGQTRSASSDQAEVKQVGAETVVNAPLPTQEQLDSAARLREVLIG